MARHSHSIETRGRGLFRLAALLATAVSAQMGFGPGAVAAPPLVEWDTCNTVDPDTGEARIDAMCFFELLVARYRGITAYEDTARVLQVTERAGESPRRVETQIGCAVDNGRLQVETPGSALRRQLGRQLGLHARTRSSQAMKDAALRYNIWLAPHMALKFADTPDRNFRSGVEDGFTATEAAHVKLGDKPMVHLELKSCDRESSECDAKFDLYVNPDSMLVEHIDGQQRLPDGATYATSLDITPLYAQTDAQTDTRTDDDASEGIDAHSDVVGQPAPASVEPVGLPSLKQHPG